MTVRLLDRATGALDGDMVPCGGLCTIAITGLRPHEVSQVVIEEIDQAKDGSLRVVASHVCERDVTVALVPDARTTHVKAVLQGLPGEAVMVTASWDS